MSVLLVTGEPDTSGSHMALELLDAGESVVVLDNLATGLAWAVPEDATFVEGDVADQSLVQRVIEARASMPSSISPARSWCLNRLQIHSATTSTIRSSRGR
jgi:UDP-glucose 4-epimerase